MNQCPAPTCRDSSTAQFMHARLCCICDLTVDCILGPPLSPPATPESRFTPDFHHNVIIRPLC